MAEHVGLGGGGPGTDPHWGFPGPGPRCLTGLGIGVGSSYTPKAFLGQHPPSSAACRVCIVPAHSNR